MLTHTKGSDYGLALTIFKDSAGDKFTGWYRRRRTAERRYQAKQNKNIRSIREHRTEAAMWGAILIIQRLLTIWSSVSKALFKQHIWVINMELKCARTGKWNTSEKDTPPCKKTQQKVKQKLLFDLEKLFSTEEWGELFLYSTYAVHLMYSCQLLHLANVTDDSSDIRQFISIAIVCVCVCHDWQDADKNSRFTAVFVF